MPMELKPLRKEAVPAAIEKARHYRLLNEPSSAESICRDVLRIDPENQEARITLLLSMTDQLGAGYVVAKQQVEELLDGVKDEYERAFYSGIVCERRGLSQLKSHAPGSQHLAFEWFADAMTRYEEAEKIAPPDNDDAVLRWNTCARLIERNKLAPRRDTEPLENHLGE